MAGQEPGKERTEPSSIKAQVERELVNEIVLKPETSLAFTRIFNRDGDLFSRIFSRSGADLEELKLAEVSALDDAAFAKFIERLRVLQEVPPAPESF
jgi:hypothetical protein